MSHCPPGQCWALRCISLFAPPASSPQVRQAAASVKGRLVLSVLDHIVSFPPVVMPVKEMVAACKEVGQ